MNIKKYLVVLPGIILAFVLYTLSQGFNNILGIELLGYEKSPISTAMIAILLGMFFGNVFQIRESFLRGLDFTQKHILKLGIICLGIQLKPFEFLEFGAIAIPSTIFFVHLGSIPMTITAATFGLHPVPIIVLKWSSKSAPN